MKILILGGINEALWLAKNISTTAHHVIYSLAGKGEVADLPCEVRVGGFNGIDGLADYLKTEQIDLLIDATHPYAENISFNAWHAANAAKTELWVYQRPAWDQQEGDLWIQTPHWYDALANSDFKRPFITLGSSIEETLSDIPDGQHWLVRALPNKLADGDHYTIIGDRGPFPEAAESKLLQDHKIDVIVSKNSGGDAVSAKILAARKQQIPVIMLSRPQLSEPERLFLNIETIHEALN